jgi:glutathione S-transferase
MIWENFLKQALNRGEADQQEVIKAEESFHRFAQVLEGHLDGREWLVGDSVTLADFSVGSFLALTEQAKYPINDYVDIQRWYRNIEQLPAWQSSDPAKIG